MTDSGRFRVIAGQRLLLQTISGAATVLRAYARAEHDDGSTQVLTVSAITTLAGRVDESFYSPDVVLKDGWVVFAVVELLTNVKRGQTFVRLSLSPTGAMLIEDYVYQNHWPSLGMYGEPGPGGGNGFLDVLTVKAEGAPAASTSFSLAASRVLRKVYGFMWYYESSSDVATRVLTVELRGPLGAVPTGFGVNAGDTWLTPTIASLSLTADEDGSVFADPHRSGKNDDGTITIDIRDSAAEPTPFPYWAEEGDPVALLFQVASSNANDLDVIYALVETWLVP